MRQINASQYEKINDSPAPTPMEILAPAPMEILAPAPMEILAPTPILPVYSSYTVYEFPDTVIVDYHAQELIEDEDGFVLV
jgi:hypothetical protein